MFNWFRGMGFALGCLAAVLIFGAALVVSWLATCGIVYLIALCFDWAFSWGIATGVWLVLCLITAFFSPFFGGK